MRVFEESWLGYGNDLSAPAEDVQTMSTNKDEPCDSRKETS